MVNPRDQAGERRRKSIRYRQQALKLIPRGARNIIILFSWAEQKVHRQVTGALCGWERIRLKHSKAFLVLYNVRACARKQSVDRLPNRAPVTTKINVLQNIKYTHTHTYTRARARTHTHTHIHARTRARARTHTHTTKTQQKVWLWGDLFSSLTVNTKAKISSS